MKSGAKTTDPLLSLHDISSNIPELEQSLVRFISLDREQIMDLIHSSFVLTQPYSSKEAKFNLSLVDALKEKLISMHPYFSFVDEDIRKLKEEDGGYGCLADYAREEEILISQSYTSGYNEPDIGESSKFPSVYGDVERMVSCRDKIIAKFEKDYSLYRNAVDFIFQPLNEDKAITINLIDRYLYHFSYNEPYMPMLSISVGLTIMAAPRQNNEKPLGELEPGKDFEEWSSRYYASEDTILSMNHEALFKYELYLLSKLNLYINICANCGSYFVQKSGIKEKYCDMIDPTSGKSCKRIGSAKLANGNRKNDPIAIAHDKEYNRIYKGCKAGNYTLDARNEWKSLSREKQVQVRSGEISIEEYKSWLNGSHRILIELMTGR